jgi:hypothetical protein
VVLLELCWVFRALVGVAVEDSSAWWGMPVCESQVKSVKVSELVLELLLVCLLLFWSLVAVSFGFIASEKVDWVVSALVGVVLLLLVVEGQCSCPGDI